MEPKRAFLITCTLAACSGEPHRDKVEVPVMDTCFGLRDGVICNAGAALTCAGGQIASSDPCVERGQICSTGVGCRVCEPLRTSCDGNKRYSCSADGMANTLVEECAAGLSCAPQGCQDLCAQAAKDRSYLGCDYWPVFTVNSELFDEFDPAVAIGNGNLVPAHVKITQGSSTIAELDVAANSAATASLKFTAALKRPGGSRLVRQGAYHLVSSVPVTVHQFNPLLYELPFDCAGERALTPPGQTYMPDNKCNSYTNDASLLLPSTALALANDAKETTFYTFSRSSFEASRTADYQGTSGFVAVTAVGGAPVHVRVVAAAYISASPDGASDPLAALKPGDTLEKDLQPGDVLQLASVAPTTCLGQVTTVPSSDGTVRFCDPGVDYDLTGTVISADGAIQVISGHDCTNVPFDRVACDHLEESMLPLSTWGTGAVLVVPRKSAGGQSVVRVLSGADNNRITFDPPLHEPITLARGATVELTATQSVFIQGTDRLAVAQYLVGAQGALVSDPSLTMAVPVDQYRQDYNFLTPASYEQNVIDIVATTGDVITVDGQVVTGFTQVGSSRFSTASLELPMDGAHRAQGNSAAGFAMQIYGLGSYTSYMLPGGMDLAPLVIGF